MIGKFYNSSRMYLRMNTPAFPNICMHQIKQLREKFEMKVFYEIIFWSGSGENTGRENE